VPLLNGNSRARGKALGKLELGALERRVGCFRAAAVGALRPTRLLSQHLSYWEPEGLESSVSAGI
jgi:hypothetical protein